jgi:hypothetical protein
MVEALKRGKKAEDFLIDKLARKRRRKQDIASAFSAA